MKPAKPRLLLLAAVTWRRPRQRVNDWAIRLIPVLVCALAIGGVLALSVASAQTTGANPTSGTPAASSAMIGELGALLQLLSSAGSLTLVIAVWWYERARSREILQSLLDVIEKIVDRR